MRKKKQNNIYNDKVYIYIIYINIEHKNIVLNYKCTVIYIELYSNFYLYIKIKTFTYTHTYRYTYIYR